MAAFGIAVLPVVPGFVRAAVTPGGSVADPNFFDRLYAYAWFVTFGLSFVVYLVLMRSRRSSRPARSHRVDSSSSRSEERRRTEIDMPRIVKCGLIQASHACSTSEKLDDHPRGEHRQAHEADRARRARGGPDPLHAGDLHRPLFLRRAEHALVRRGRSDSGRPDDSAHAGSRPPLLDGDRRSAVRGGWRRHLLQHGGGYRRRWILSGQVSQEPHPPLRAGILGEVLFPSGQPGVPGLQDPVRRRGRLHLL